MSIQSPQKGATVNRRRAIATVEFALILPVLLYILLGIFEIGWMVRSQLTLANATREGVRYAALGNPSSSVVTRVKNTASAVSPALQESQIYLEQTADKSSQDATYTAWPSDTTGTASKNGVPVGNLVRIRIAYPYRPITGFFPFLKDRTLNVSTTMSREIS